MFALTSVRKMCRRHFLRLLSHLLLLFIHLLILLLIIKIIIDFSFSNNNNHKLFVAPHLVRALSAYKDIMVHLSLIHI